MQLVEGQVVVVTGAASGIGRGMARAFAERGLRVVLADVVQDALDAAVEELRVGGTEAVGIATDVSKRSDVERLAEATLDTFGAVHVLCNNAGVGIFAPIAKTTLDDWEWTIAIDLWGPIHGVSVFLPLIEREGTGHINSTSSIAGLVAGSTAGPYNVAKHGVVALMTTLERELRAGKSPVRASVLCPGAVNTSIASNSLVNRRTRRGGQLTERTREGEKLGDKLSTALAHGMDPNEVGRLVVAAIETDSFWIFTDRRLLQQVQEQVEQMVEASTLSRLRLF